MKYSIVLDRNLIINDIEYRHVQDSFMKLYKFYIGESHIMKWDELELILNEKYHAKVIHNTHCWKAIYFESESDLVVFKLTWL